MEQCIYCKRERPTYITDASCSKGGYCDWQTTELDVVGDAIDSDELEDAFNSLGRPRLIRMPRPTKAVRMWLPLNRLDGSGDSTTFSTQPDIVFKPCGLMFWNLPDDAILEICRVCNQEVVLAGYGPLPAKIFARAQSYEDLKKLVEDGETLFNEWISCPAVTPANRIYIILRSKIGSFSNTQAAFWGNALTY